MQAAQANADEDKRKQEEIEAKNRLDGLVYGAEKTVQDNKEKLPAEVLAAAESALAAARQALAEGGQDRLEQATRDLTTASHRMAEALYKQTAPGGGEGGAGGPQGETPGGARAQADGDGGEVVDAEVTDRG